MGFKGRGNVEPSNPESIFSREEGEKVFAVFIIRGYGPSAQ